MRLAIFLPAIRGSAENSEFSTHVPALFWPQNPVPQVESSISICQQRVEAFQTALTLAGMSEDFQGLPREASLAYTLLGHRDDLVPLLENANLVNLDFPHLGEFEVFGQMFATLFDLYPPFFPYLLNKLNPSTSRIPFTSASTPPVLLKAVILSTSTIPLVDRMYSAICACVRMYPELRLSAACREGRPVALVDQLDVNEFYFLFKTIEHEITRNICPHVLTIGRGNLATIELKDEMDDIPMEVHPRVKAMCVTTGLAHFCNVLNARWKHLLASTGLVDLAAKIQGLRELLKNERGFKRTTLEKQFIAFHVDLGEDLEEFSDVPIEITRIFPQAVDAFPMWPLIDRLIRETEQSRRKAELALVESGAIDFFLAHVTRLCRYRECSHVPGAFAEIQLEELEPLLTASDAEEGSILGQEIAEKFVSPEMHKLEEFMNKRLKTNQPVKILTICGYCAMNFCKGRRQIELCPGHVICQQCVKTTFLRSSDIVCPVCHAHFKLDDSPLLDVGKPIANVVKSGFPYPDPRRSPFFGSVLNGMHALISSVLAACAFLIVPGLICVIAFILHRE